MSNGPAHRRIGTLTGGAFALYQARDLPPYQVLAETVGGLLGGRLGASAPDIIDPPWCPRHRGIGHGVLTVGAALKYART